MYDDVLLCKCYGFGNSLRYAWIKMLILFGVYVCFSLYFYFVLVCFYLFIYWYESYSILKTGTKGEIMIEYGKSIENLFLS